MQPEHEPVSKRPLDQVVIISSTIRLEHKFVSGLSVNDQDAAKARREVRSHAARVSAPNGAETGVLSARSGTRRRRPKKALIWPVELQTSEQSKRAVSNTLRAFPSSSAVVPAAESPASRLSFIPLLLDNYLEHLAVAISELDGPDPSPVCALRKDWFPMVMHFPTIFQVIILFSASHYASTHNVMSMASDILSLKHLAISGLKNTIATATDSRVEDDVIAAAVKMASYEAIYGCETAYHTHMNGVKDMVVIRGGLGALGLDGLIQRMI